VRTPSGVFFVSWGRMLTVSCEVWAERFPNEEHRANYTVVFWMITHGGNWGKRRSIVMSTADVMRWGLPWRDW
jgi:acyl-CoA hydrolase